MSSRIIWSEAQGGRNNLHRISELAKSVFDKASNGEDISIKMASDSNRSAASSIEYAVKGHRMSVIHGPPGTGKTTTFAYVVNNMVGAQGNSLDSNEIFLYIAPTNELVKDMFQKVAVSYALSNDLPALKREVRVYGSQFDFSPDWEILNRQIGPEVKTIITTNYQRVFVPREMRPKFHILVDEASKSPLHSPFQALAHDITQSGELDGSFSIVGDPMQAISLSESYQSSNKRMLLMPYILRGMLDIPADEFRDNQTLLNEAERNLSREIFNFLDTTLRLPSPTHKGISEGFYSGGLKSKYLFRDRVRINEANQNLSKQLSKESESLGQVTDSIQGALDTEKLLIFFHDNSRDPYSHQEGVLYNSRRGEIGIQAAIALSVLTGEKTAIITTYVDQYLQMRMLFQSKYASIGRKYGVESKISFNTTQSMLGAESYNTVLILGKEYKTGIYGTIYFMEPELLNVQLSRNRGPQLIIGNLPSLERSAAQSDRRELNINYKPLEVTSRIILNQAGFEKGPANWKKRRDGDECEYMKLPE
jgi:hypothetical protein